MILTIFFLTAAIGAIGGASIKFTLGDFPPMILIFLRGALAALLLLPVIYFRRGKFTLKKEKKLLLISGILFALNWVLFAYGIQKTTIIMGQLIYLPTPIIVAIIAYFTLREKITLDQIIGLAITLIGMVILTQGALGSKDSNSFGEPLGNFIIFLGLLAWSLYTITSRKISQIYSPLHLTFINLLSVTLISFVILMFPQPRQNFNPEFVTTSGIFGLISVATLNSIGFFGLYQWLIKNTSAFRASLILYPTTVLASIVGIVFFKEKLTLNLIIGGMSVLIGVFIASSLKHVRNYARR